MKPKIKNKPNVVEKKPQQGRFKIGTKFILILTFIAVLSVLSVGLLSYRIGKNIINKQIDQLLTVQTENTLESINTFIFNRFNDLQLLISDSTLINPEASQAEKTQVLQKNLISLGWYDQIHFINAEGKVIASTLGEAVGDDLSNADWYQTVKADFIHVTDVVFSPYLQKNVLIFSNTVQDKNNNVLGYVVAEFSLDVVQDLLKEIPDGFEAYLISKNGKVIAHKGPAATNNPSISSSGLYQLPENFLQKQVPSMGYFNFDGNDWQLSMQILKETAYAPINDFTYLLLVFALLIMLLVIILGHFSGIQFVKPILLLTEGVSQVRQGNLKQKIPIRTNDELGYLAETFNSMISEIEESERAKLQFIHVASHKLRTPITTLNWNTQMLLDGTFGKISKDQKDTVKQMQNVSNHLSALTNILVNVSEIKNNKVTVQKEAFVLKDFLASVITEFEGRMKEANIVFKNNLDQLKAQKVKADPQKIKTVLTMILDNAILYRKLDSKNQIELNIDVKSKKKKAVVILKDQGIGIPLQEQPRVFTKFFRSKQTELAYPDGTGLSLFLVKVILDSSKEKIWFESEEGKGTSFSFTLELL